VGLIGDGCDGIPLHMRELDLFATELYPFRPNTDPGEFELLLVVVVVVVVIVIAVRPLLLGPATLQVVRKGETREPRSSSQKSSLLASQLNEQ
jgi:hypothetical protein